MPNIDNYEAKDLVAPVKDEVPTPERSIYYEEIIKAIGNQDYGGEIKTASVSTATLESATNSLLLNQAQLKRAYPYAVALTNPLTYDFLARVHDNIRRDGAPRRCIKTIVTFMLGKRPKPELDTKQHFASEDDKKIALKELQQDTNNQELLTRLMDIDKNCNVRKAWKSLAFLGMAYGRAVCVKQYDNEHLPKNLIVLSSLRLGQVWVDSRDWRFLGVEYLDYSTERRILQAKDIIHYEYDDYPITPNSRYFGMPIFEGLTALIESNRITSEVVIPELSKKAFAPQQLIVVPDAKSKEKLAEIASLIVPGKTAVLRKMVDVKTIPLVVDILMQTQKIKDVDQKVFRDSQVPVGIAFPSEPNRATMDEELNQWEEGPLEDIRTDFRDLVEPQWYEPNAKQIKLNKQMSLTRSTDPLAMNNWANLIGPKPTFTDLEKITLDFKINLVFTNIQIEGMVNKAAAVIGYKNAGIIDEIVALKIAGLEQYIDELRDRRTQNIFANKLNEKNLYNAEKNRINDATTSISQSLQGVFPKSGTNIDINNKIDEKLQQGLSKLRSGRTNVLND